MNPTDLDFWRRQWEAFSSAPIACLVFLVVGAVAAWWFRKSVDQGETKGLRAQIDALEQRLKLATEQEQVAIKATQSTKEEIATLKAQMKGVGVATAAVEERLLAVRRAQERVLGTLRPSGGMGPDGGQVQLPEIGSLGLVLAQPPTDHKSKTDTPPSPKVSGLAAILARGRNHTRNPP